MEVQTLQTLRTLSQGVQLRARAPARTLTDSGKGLQRLQVVSYLITYPVLNPCRRCDLFRSANV
ncbi:MAG: hypothetical protein KatS3mg111_0906 [Pirellulaceae bacterium]|nr:MAG: hypothetical protein KatS3mg111_0906 [Pirellulaceae bacterium]